MSFKVTICKVVNWELNELLIILKSKFVLLSTVTYPLVKINSRQTEKHNDEINDKIKKVLNLLAHNPSMTQPKVAEQLGYIRNIIQRFISIILYK